MKEILTKERLIMNFDHFDEIAPSKWNEGTIVQVKVLLRLTKKFLNGEAVMVTMQKPEKKEEIKDIFPESEGWRNVNAAGLNNANSESPNETVSQRMEDNLSQ